MPHRHEGQSVSIQPLYYNHYMQKYDGDWERMIQHVGSVDWSCLRKIVSMSAPCEMKESGFNRTYR